MTPAPTLHGIDGCPAGWLILTQHPDARISACIHSSLDEFAPRLGPDHIVAIDMPIGLPCPDHYPRACDTGARQALGSRACCVFSAPCRGTLDHIDNYTAASAWHKDATGKAISHQAFNILPKIHELDTYLGRHPATAAFYEVHPEISFAHMNGSDEHIAPLLNKKSFPTGEHERAALIAANLSCPAELSTLQQQLGPRSKDGKTRWALNDLHDALAALWTAQRISTGTATTYPPNHPTSKDKTGKSMRIMA
ncbi:MAG: DUF429 domain-containing protein [Akkermansiaceae bacterium]